MSLFRCPHCDIIILVEELNCGIFRCGALKTNGEPIPPHLNREACEKLHEDGDIYGCGKPFQINKNTLEITICDYI